MVFGALIGEDGDWRRSQEIMPTNDQEQPPGLLGAASRSLRNAGILRSVQRVVQKTVPSWIFDMNSQVAVDYDLDEWRDIQLDEKWQHRWATDQDYDLLKMGGLSDREIQNYRDHNARAHFISKDGETIAYSWLVEDCWEVFEWARVRLAPGEIYASSAYVAPAHRGQRLRGELRKFAWRELAEEGNKRVVTFVEMLKRSSLRSQVKPARRYVGRVWYMRLLGLVIYRIDGKWGAGFWSLARPFERSFDMCDRYAPSRPLQRGGDLRPH
jgi:GNAT superfamily N-acetyltransferase